jgi:hypothetical protein
MAFGNFLLGSHNFMVTAFGSCVKGPLGMQAVVNFHKVPNMSKDMFIKKTFPVDGFLENEPAFGRVKLTLDRF